MSTPDDRPIAPNTGTLLCERIVASLGEAVAVFDPDGRLRLANPACRRLLGRELPRGAPVQQVLPADDPLRPFIARALAGEQLENWDIHYRRPDGQRRWLRLDAMALADGPGPPVATMLAFKDVSELKRAERHIWQVEKMSALGRLAASVAHEVGNPLGAIDIQLQLLEEDTAAVGGELAEAAKRRLQIARSEMRRLDTIVRNFLRFSRPPALRLKRVQPNELLRHIFALVEPEAREHEIALDLDLTPSVPSIEVDENQLSQAVLNLLINAFQAVPDGSRIQLQSSVVDEDVLITIRDQGHGIPQKHLERIFEFYYTTKDEGTGLGLSIAQRIVHQHGGALTVESVEGEGTQVYVRLPAAD
jgi:PAS domain S-box-containing protein